MGGFLRFFAFFLMVCAVAAIFSGEREMAIYFGVLATYSRVQALEYTVEDK